MRGILCRLQKSVYEWRAEAYKIVVDDSIEAPVRIVSSETSCLVVHLSCLGCLDNVCFI